MYIYIYIYTHTSACIYLCIYIYVPRRRAHGDTSRRGGALQLPTYVKKENNDTNDVSAARVVTSFVSSEIMKLGC